MNHFLSLLSNKYLLVSVAFLVWMLFFDRNDIMLQYKYNTQLSDLEQQRDFYVKETAQVKKDLNELTTNRARLEKFAREKYFMKKDHEDVYVIVTEQAEEQ